MNEIKQLTQQLKRASEHQSISSDLLSKCLRALKEKEQKTKRAVKHFK